ncbi:PIG-L family deacetylase [candidate division KSB1 bacterium]|nr:PIG-L family deacetylase [candidate division KSB1 bacterium]
MKKTALAIAAHPDDVEFMCAGTLALLRVKGWQIIIATMTPGDCGSTKLSREEISSIRLQEAQISADILAAGYFCLECDDVFIMYDKPTLLKTIQVVRKVKPSIVFTHSPSDYMVDHEMTSKLVQTACFSAGMVNIKTPGAAPFESVPFLYYMDPMEGKDIFGNEINPNIIIDINDVIDTKEKMLYCHKSQRDWLLEHHGIDEYIRTMKDFSRKRGEEINTHYAEGFRQHKGHAFPDKNILKHELADVVFLM